MLLDDENLTGLKIKLSMAKQGDFSAGYVQAVGEHHSRYSGTSAHLTVEWIEATQDEPELMDAHTLSRMTYALSAFTP
ncbi:hypothetical protein HBH64_090200 [Parastagonospora nodorum]|nr:hypothetical protein HBH52_122400 [Parastagonospora nodorum]KAH4288022.1 hypothetical protein HBI01_224120 [Parastagonospora nodorum]KAH4304804.1 hypothetical protein HBI02_123100 [Parastagonospora nodorum]KAH4323741.1 hypothetical protein HBI00_177870 [Parastagonospora nodorum]KAH4367665.1 hypothetical protein HBH94_136060 [Parastagonospora nodorum]